MRKKKLLSAVVISAALMMSLTACGDKEFNPKNSEKETTEITSEVEDTTEAVQTIYTSSEEVIEAFWQAYADVDKDLFASCFADISNAEADIESNYTNAQALQENTVYHLDKTEMTYVSDAAEKAKEYNYNEDFDTATYSVNVYITQTIDGVDYDAVDRYNMYTVYYDDSWYLFCIESLGAEVIDTTEDTTDVETTTEDTENEKTDDTPTDAVAVDGLSDIYADLDNRSFILDGHLYTLGVSTLQDMIDNGVEFTNAADAGNNIEPNYSSNSFKVELGEYNTLQVYVGNYTDENKIMSECPLCEVYLPIDLDKEGNERIQFAFPFDITEEELVANSGEPTEKDEYVSDDGKWHNNTYEYTRDSEKYIGSSGYRFEFSNGELNYFYLDLK